MARFGFDWKSLPPGECQTAWRDLADWVNWLQEHYGAWVKLPPCWPRHEALRGELMFLRAMHSEALASEGGYDGANWHQMLRGAAEEWKLLADCKHEEPPWKSGRGSDHERQFEHHLKVAMDSARAGGATGGAQPPLQARPPLPHRS